MRTIEIHEAKRHLSCLVQEAAEGEPFIITRAGKPLVKVVPVETPEPAEARRTGFMVGEASVPADFDGMGSEEIAATFEGSD